jgi:FixJ family two-component response regulator
MFIASYGDVPTTVQEMKGSYEFLMKPFSDDMLLKATLDGIKRSQAALDHEAENRHFGNVTRPSAAANGRSWRW